MTGVQTCALPILGTLNTYSEVELATYNAVAKNRDILHDKEYCNKEYDNHKLSDNDMCNFEDMEYYLAIPLMGLVREHMTLNKVTVAVFDSRIETGLDQSNKHLKIMM